MTNFITNEFYTWIHTKTGKTEKFKYVAGDWSDKNGILYDFKTLSEAGWVLLSNQ